MTVDGCQYSFEELALRVLPAYMAQLRKRMETPTPLRDFNVKGIGPVTLAKTYGLSGDPSGCYAILDKGRPVYVGISQHVIQRIMEHIRRGDHYTASLAYRIAFHRYPHTKTADQAMQDLLFRSRFDEAQAYIRELDVAFIEISNPLELYVFEAYCAMELQTGLDSGGWNTFATH